MTVLGFDHGTRRIGVAVGRMGWSSPLGVIDAGSWQKAVQQLIAEHKPDQLVVGLPRGLDGQDTAQTAIARQFAEQLQNLTGLPVAMIDEAGTSELAKERLRRPHRRGDVDAEAAAIIVTDYLGQV